MTWTEVPSEEFSCPCCGYSGGWCDDYLEQAQLQLEEGEE